MEGKLEVLTKFDLMDTIAGLVARKRWAFRCKYLTPPLQFSPAAKSLPRKRVSDSDFSRFSDSSVWSNAKMAMACEICGKKPSFGNTISHAHNVTRAAGIRICGA